MPDGGLRAYRDFVLKAHTHTWEPWDLDQIGSIEVCECGNTRTPEPAGDPKASTADT